MAMFSFFRKGQAHAKPVIPNDVKPARSIATERAVSPPPVVAPPAPPPPPEQAQKTPDNTGIQVLEMEVLLAPEIEQAVMHYANGRTGEATATLNRYILDHPNTIDTQPWCLLFDIYEITGQRRPFEDLAVDFAVRFERSPPTWSTVQPVETGKAASRHPTFAFGPNLSPQDKAGLEHFHQECETAETVVLDFSKTPVPGDDAYARLMLDNLTRSVAKGKEVHLVGGEAFVVRLNASRAVGHLTESTWLLLLMLLQLQARHHEFDEVAVEYAIRYEISPPSYTAPKRISTLPEALALEPSPTGHTFPMKGVLGAGSTSVFEELRTFATPLPRVEVDLSQVIRIDFAIVGLLMDTVMGLAQAGKQVVFRGGNSMVNLLLQMLGVGQFATIQQETLK
jgi:anti-anti-sigma regulatory factor